MVISALDFAAINMTLRRKVKTYPKQNIQETVVSTSYSVGAEYESTPQG
jgi:hypothetical protein